ncbi:MAG: hypothetical protein M1404_04605 [Acidobacteria bacterium]|nr:hypothetical protein [Acidobacteriota bacterium]
MRFRFQSLPQPSFWVRRRGANALAGLLAVIGALVSCPVASSSPRTRVIWNFDHRLTNSLGGQYNAFSMEPSWTRTYLDPIVHRFASGHSLRITAHREPEGFCGVWFDFYPAASIPKRYFDARLYPYLSFWIKGAKPGGDFDIKIVDARGERRDGVAATQPLHDYLPMGITTGWQKVAIPLADFPETDPGSLARLVFIFSVPGDYQFYVDDIAVESSINSPDVAPFANEQEHLTNEDMMAYHSMWVWNTVELLTSAWAADRFFDFCAHMGLKEIYLSVDFEPSSASSVPASLQDAGRYGNFLRMAHQRGLRVEALAGAPAWAASANHPRATGAVRAIVKFNAVAAVEERFDGIHFDVEPYLLLGFAVPHYRKRLLEEYLEMVAECAEAARREHIAFTCDIPWWFYPVTPAAREQFTVSFQGREETVGKHVTDLLDSVTIMDYRNEADGAGGIIASGTEALAYAAKVHKKIQVGLETSAEKETSVEFVVALPANEFLAKLQEKHLADQRSFEGYTLHALRAETVVFIGLGPSPSSGFAPKVPIEVALTRLRRMFAVKSGDRLSVKRGIQQARSAIAMDPEWKDFEPVELRESGSDVMVAAFRAIRGTPSIITFRGLGRKVFEEESRSAAEWLGKYSSFGGLAIHYYQSFRALMATP